jgi:hypothetical protein
VAILVTTNNNNNNIVALALPEADPFIIQRLDLKDSYRSRKEPLQSKDRLIIRRRWWAALLKEEVEIHRKAASVEVISVMKSRW